MRNIGDVFEIQTKTGFGYFQLVKGDNFKGDLIRIFYGNHKESLNNDNINKILDNDFYFLRFPLKFAIKKEAIDFKKNLPIEESLIIPHLFREKHLIRGEFKGWNIVDDKSGKMHLVKKLSKEEEKLSPAGIVNDTFIINRFEENWKLEDWK